MSVTVDGLAQRRAAALERAAEVRRERYRLRCEARRVGREDGASAGRARVADVIVECPDWLAAADALDVLTWAPGVGARVQSRDGSPVTEGVGSTALALYALTGAHQAHTLGELSPRQRGVLADGLRGLGR